MVDYLELLRTGYYFDFVYMSNHVKNSHQEELKRQMEAVIPLERFNTDEDLIAFENEKLPEGKKMSEDDKIDYYFVRQFLVAAHNRNLGNKTTFPLEKATSLELECANVILGFCHKWNYYPWEINRCLNAESLATFFDTYKVLPHPYAFPGTSKGRFIQNVIYFKGDFDSYPLSKEFKQIEMKETLKLEKEKILCLIEEEPKNEYNTFLKKQNELLINLFEGKTIRKTSKQSMFSSQKKIEMPLFRRMNTFWSRLLGYALWEAKNSIYHKKIKALKNNFPADRAKILNNISITEALEQMLSIKIFEKLVSEIEPARAVFDQRNAERWYKATDTSIKKGEYVKIS